MIIMFRCEIDQRLDLWHAVTWECSRLGNVDQNNKHSANNSPTNVIHGFVLVEIDTGDSIKVGQSHRSQGQKSASPTTESSSGAKPKVPFELSWGSKVVGFLPKKTDGSYWWFIHLWIPTYVKAYQSRDRVKGTSTGHPSQHTFHDYPTLSHEEWWEIESPLIISLIPISTNHNHSISFTILSRSYLMYSGWFGPQ